MVRTVSRQVMSKRGPSEMVKFVISGLNSSAASRCADMLKFNLEFKSGLHTDKRKPYKQGDFDALGEFEVL